MSTRLGVAVVGAGVIGRAHARVAVAHPGLRLVSLVDRDADAARELARYVQVELEGDAPAIGDSLESVLADPTIDLVVVTTPSGSHVEIAEAAVNAGKHVVIEKPIDVQLDRARRMVALAERAAASGLVVTVISQNRFAPAVVAVKRAIESGRFGRVTSATATVAWWRSQEYYDSGDWRGTWAFDGGGALMNQGVHTVDLLLHFLGRPVEVFGYASALVHERIEVEDVAASVIRFESGAMATLLATTDAFPENSTRLQVHGSTGSAFLQNELLEFFHADDAHLAGEPRGFGGLGNQAAREVTEHDLPGAPPVTELFRGHLRQYEDIIEAIATGREPGVTAGQATDALALVRAVYLSQTLGRPVAFADVLAGRHDDVEPVIGSEPDQVGTIQAA
ncbi:Gfo/Idh/MocA family protein [Agromyces humatus]|uniref:Gfo/Idh/MocA family oxidoreductase n=1 Tax=Agromyces humatus TaxID=279573 RepID=A0ABN2KRZ6_9MICO|nr:Gfo/Idh/MocA family oxidoreductase [Agromyces humatus]